MSKEKKKQKFLVKYSGAIVVALVAIIYLSSSNDSDRIYVTEENTFERSVEERISGKVNWGSQRLNKIIDIQSVKQASGQDKEKLLLKIVYRAPTSMRASVVSDATDILLKLSDEPQLNNIGEVMLIPHLINSSGKELQVGKIVIELSKLKSIQRNMMVTIELEQFYSVNGEFKVWGI